MNALRLMCYFALLMVLLPWRAQAADADDFVAANRSQQAQLLERWAAAPEASRLPLLRALKSETLQSDSGGHAFSKQGETLLALGAVAAPEGATKPVRLTNRLRNLAAGALATHLLVSDNVTERAAAVKTLQREATPEMAGLLQQRLTAESDGAVEIAAGNCAGPFTACQPAARAEAGGHRAARPLRRPGNPGAVDAVYRCAT
ncbi:Urea ABC transporter [Klebsiella grimontii]|uniref:Urea ABC transporter n=1 Tax=Klebsiella grimontii TaxID=2058152 RepID=A0A7H4P364_9ENTR|nr:Urea ABC transporter [Klebsiella grimontii]